MLVETDIQGRGNPDKSVQGQSNLTSVCLIKEKICFMTYLFFCPTARIRLDSVRLDFKGEESLITVVLDPGLLIKT